MSPWSRELSRAGYGGGGQRDSGHQHHMSCLALKMERSVYRHESDPCPGASKEPGTSVYGHMGLGSANTLNELGSGFSPRVSR